MTLNKSYYPSTVLLSAFFMLISVLFGCVEGSKEEVYMNAVEVVEAPVKEVSESIEAMEDIPAPMVNDIVLCFGNSLTEGYGLKNEEAYPALLQKKVDSAMWEVAVVNAGLSGETTSGGKGRLDWVLKSQANRNVKVFILELGPNDGLRGINLEATKQNLQSIIDTVKARLPQTHIVLAGMKIPPNMGADYSAKFETIFPALADSNDIHLIPFLLEGVAGDKTLNQEDGIHPTAEGTKIVVENVWKVVAPLLK